MALQKFGEGGGQVLEGPAETASRKNGKVRWHCGTLVRRVWGGRGADRPKPPVGKMAKSDGIAEVS